MVSYFAGLFYTVRLFVYYKDTDAFDNPKRDILREQYAFMASRLWNIITVPGGTHADFWYYNDLYESGIIQDAMVSFKAYSISRSGYLSLLVLEESNPVEET